MADQTLIQIRVDTELKEQASEIFEKIGIDIPTAIRMFFKATVREQGLPFGTNVDDRKTGETENSEVGKLVDFLKNKFYYHPPVQAEDDNVIVLLPLKYGKEVPGEMVAQLITKVPKGSLTRWEDIDAFLREIYGQKISAFSGDFLPKEDTLNHPIPYWRIVSTRGTLEGGILSKERQRDLLMEEGFQVVKRGSQVNSYRVENYKEYLFNFNSLKIIR